MSVLIRPEFQYRENPTSHVVRWKNILSLITSLARQIHFICASNLFHNIWEEDFLEGHQLQALRHNHGPTKASFWLVNFVRMSETVQIFQLERFAQTLRYACQTPIALILHHVICSMIVLFMCISMRENFEFIRIIDASNSLHLRIKFILQYMTPTTGAMP